MLTWQSQAIPLFDAPKVKWNTLVKLCQMVWVFYDVQHKVLICFVPHTVAHMHAHNNINVIPQPTRPL